MKQLLISIVLLISVSGASANDSIARVATGGITFTKSTDIRMLEEVLQISTKTVRVKYRFLNESDQDVHATVAFPMPTYGWNAGVSASDANVGPVTTFNVLVNGRHLSTTTHRKAMIGDRDVTDRLRKLGLSDEQILDTFGGCRIENLGGIVSDLTADQKKAIDLLWAKNGKFPQWKVAATVLWEQTFPAGKEVIVEHSYTPFVGKIYTVPYQKQKKYTYISPDILPAPYKQNNPKEACIDEGTRQTIQNRINSYVAKGAKNITVWRDDVEYILATGRNWKGPIGEFRLLVEKDTADQIISLCFPDKPREINSKTYEFVHRNFVPQDTLVVYFYKVTSDREAKK